MPKPDVANNAQTTTKMLGGVTGKGFMPGQSGNPSGRPRKQLLTECYEALIERPLPEDLRGGLKLLEGAIYGDAIAMGQARAAIKGKTDAAREIADRLEGRARQAVEVSGPQGTPIDVRFMSEEQLDQRIEELLAIVNKEKAGGPPK